MSHSHNDIINTISDAMEAYKTKPELEQRIDYLETELKICHNHCADYQVQLGERDYTIAELKAKLKEVTDERDAAGFRELEALEAVSTERLRAAEASKRLQDILNVLSPADEAPKTEPAKETVDSGPFVSEPDLNKTAIGGDAPSLTNVLGGGDASPFVDTVHGCGSVIVQGDTVIPTVMVINPSEIQQDTSWRLVGLI